MLVGRYLSIRCLLSSMVSFPLHFECLVFFSFWGFPWDFLGSRLKKSWHSPRIIWCWFVRKRVHCGFLTISSSVILCRLLINRLIFFLPSFLPFFLSFCFCSLILCSILRDSLRFPNIVFTIVDRSIGISFKTLYELLADCWTWYRDSKQFPLDGFLINDLRLSFDPPRFLCRLFQNSPRVLGSRISALL